MEKFRFYEEFTYTSKENLNEVEDNVNEGLFDKLFSWMGKIGQMFAKPEAVQKSVESTITTAALASPKALIPKSIAIKETYFVMMGDGKNAATNFSLSLTKMSDLPDGNGLFQITGTTNPEMLKALTGSIKVEDLVKNTVMAIVTPASFLKGKPITIKILKNIMPQGKDYVSKFLVTGIAPGTAVEKAFNNTKTT
jgi:hypothetical protein